LKAFPSIVERIFRDISEKLSGDFLSLAGLKEVLNAIEVFMVVEHEEVLILLTFWEILELLHGVQGSKSRYGQVLLELGLEGEVADQGQWLKVGSRCHLTQPIREDVHLLLIEVPVLVLH
jgi:hypothetical protein